MRYRNCYGQRNKLGNTKIVVDGIEFDSKREATRYSELKLMERVKLISNLELQKEFELIPAQREPDTTGKRGGVIKGKVIERAVRYIADFAYIDNKTGQLVVEDSKGYRDPASAEYAKFVIKRKLMLYKYGIRVKEV